MSSSTGGKNDGVWRHYAFNRRGNKLELWINGLLDNSITLATVQVLNDTTPIYLMSRYVAAIGSMDEVALYAHALSLLQVKAHFYSQANDSDGDHLTNVYEMQDCFAPWMPAMAVQPIPTATGTRTPTSISSKPTPRSTRSATGMRSPPMHRLATGVSTMQRRPPLMRAGKVTRAATPHPTRSWLLRRSIRVLPLLTPM